MAEIIQCPGCLQLLNLELREAKVVSIWEDKIYYKCEKCGLYFTEEWEVKVGRENE